MEEQSNDFPEFNEPQDIPPVRRGVPQESSFRRLAVVSVFLLIVLIIMGMQHLGSKQLQMDRDQSSAQLLFAGRYAIGVNEMGLQDLAAMGDSSDLAGKQMMEQIKSQVTNASDALCATILMGELGGSEAALTWLDQAEKDYDFSDAITRDAALIRKIYAEGLDSLQEAERLQLEERQGWFGKLALVYGLNDEEPAREAALKPARRVFYSTIFMAVGMLALGGIGLVMFIIAMVMFFNNRIKPAYTRHVQNHSASRLAYLETMALFMVLFAGLSMVAGVLAHVLPAGSEMVLSGIGFALPLCSIYWLVVRRNSLAQIKQAIGWNMGRGLFRETVSGLVGYLAGLPIVAMGFAITFILIQFTGDQPTHPIVDQFQDGNFMSLLMVFLLACVGAPIIEETMFRGVLYHYLRGFGPALVSALLTGLIFAAIHPQGLNAIPVLAALGVVFALLREWRGSLIAPMVAHGCNNFIVLSLGVIMTT